MSDPAPREEMTFADYIAREKASEIKHQFLDGEVFAMAGGTLEHALIAANIIGGLTSRLQGGPCRVFSSDARVRVSATGLTTYPDVSVICGPIERDPEDPNTATNPTLIVEVLSESTEAFDRGTKFEHYRKIPSLVAYLLVSQDKPLIEVYTRNDDGTWTLTEARPPGEVRIDALDCRLSVAEIFAGVREMAG